MPEFERHVFVCGNERPADHPRGCCAGKSADKIREALKSALTKLGLAQRIRTNKAGCLDQCEHGVTLVVYPEQVWYGFVTLEDVSEIVESHLVGNRAVERLRLTADCVNTRACPHRPARCE